MISFRGAEGVHLKCFQHTHTLGITGGGGDPKPTRQSFSNVAVLCILGEIGFRALPRPGYQQGQMPASAQPLRLDATVQWTPISVGPASSDTEN